jgi:hypothetical protein
MTRSTLRGRAAVLGTAAVLVAALCLTAAVPAGATGPVQNGSITVSSPVTVPRGGTSAGTATVIISELTGYPAAWPGAFWIQITIKDAADAAKVSFVQTSLPTLSKPDSVTATVAWSGPQSFTITGTASSTGQVESVVVGGLRIKADAEAALGPVKMTYTSGDAYYGDPNAQPSIGTVPGAAAGLSITASGATTVVRGLSNQAAGSVVITETSGHPLAANQVIQFSVANDATLGVPPATFAATPTVSANTAATGMTATIQNATATSFEVKVLTAATGATGGQLTIGNIWLTVLPNATLGPLALSLLSTGTGTPFSQTVTVATVVAAAPTVLVLTPLPGTAAPLNSSVTLRAQIIPAQPSLQIVFKAKPAGATSFATIGWASTNTAGLADWPVLLTMNTTFMAEFAGSGSMSAASSLPVVVTAIPSLSLQIAGGYKTNPSTAYGTAVAVKNGTYVTLRGMYGLAAANVPVQFFQRIGKTGAWTFLSTGRTDAAGMVVWSKKVTVPASATGYGRYVYFRIVVPASATYGAATSNAVRAVAK